MPLPSPNSGESKEKFLDRCMENDSMNSEYPDRDQRYAVCNSQWDKSKGKAMKGKMNYRSLSIRGKNGKPESLDEDSRSVEAVGATEDPIEVFDFERWEIVPEVLLMTGVEMPKSRQVPLLDSHSRYNSSSVMGSFRNMKTESDQLIGRVFFSSVPEAEGPFTKLREGHLTDFSIGYRPIRSVWIPDGEEAKVKGRSFKGPVAVAVAEHDEVIPPKHARRLFQSLSEPKHLWVFNDAGHNSWPVGPDESWWREVMDFVSGADMNAP